MKYLHELAKMGTLAAVPGLLVAEWWPPLVAVTVSAVVLYALLVRVG